MRRSKLRLYASGVHSYGSSERLAHGSRGSRHLDSSRFQSFDLLRRRSFAAGDDGARVPHASSGRRGLASNECYDRLLHVRLHKLSGSLFGIAADLADHDDGFGLGIAVEEIERIDECRSDNRITTDAYGSGLSDAALRKLMYGLVRQSARARDNPDRSFFMNRGRHDADLAFARRDNPGAIGPDQPRAAVLQELPGFDHIECGDAFRDADDQIDFGVRGFHDGIGGKWGRHENHRGIGPGFVDGFLHRIEDRPVLMRGAAFTRRDAAYNFSAVSCAGFRMECAFAPRQTLNNYPCILVNQDCHKSN